MLRISDAAYLKLRLKYALLSQAYADGCSFIKKTGKTFQNLRRECEDDVLFLFQKDVDEYAEHKDFVKNSNFFRENAV